MLNEIMSNGIYGTHGIQCLVYLCQMVFAVHSWCTMLSVIMSNGIYGTHGIQCLV